MINICIFVQIDSFLVIDGGHQSVKSLQKTMRSVDYSSQINFGKWT